MKKIPGIDVVINRGAIVVDQFKVSLAYKGSDGGWIDRNILHWAKSLSAARAFCKHHRLTVREVKK